MKRYSLAGRPGARRLVALLATVALVAGIPLAGETGASFTDEELAGVTVGTAWPPMTPVDSSLARTTMAIDANGGLYIWGYRGYGLSGTGTLTVSSNAAATYHATMPNGATVDIATGHTDGIAAGYDDYDTAIGVLDSKGQVWLWGVNSHRQMGIPVAWGEDYYRPWRICFNGERLYLKPNATTATTWAEVDAAGWTCRDNGTNKLYDEDDAEARQPKIVDLKATENTWFALDDQGNLYSWGGYTENHGGASASEANRWAYWPRLILTGVHSFGTAERGVWAIVADGWTRYDYSTNGTLSADYAAEAIDGTNRTLAAATGFTYDGCTAAEGQNCAGILYWGVQDYLAGNPRGDGESGYVKAPTHILADSVLMQFWLANRTAADAQLGVRLGSAQDGGVFQQMTGTRYGNQFLVNDGSVFLWGYKPDSADYFGSGSSTSTITLDKEVPVRYFLTTSRANPAAVAVDTLTGLALDTGLPVENPIRVRAISSTYSLVYLLDETGTLWFYGDYTYHDQLPGQMASCNATNTSVGAPNNLGTDGVSRPCRLDGGTSNPAWKAGSIMAMGTSGAAIMVIHSSTDRSSTTSPLSVWIAGYNHDAGGMVRNCIRVDQSSPAAGYASVLRIRDADPTLTDVNCK